MDLGEVGLLLVTRGEEEARRAIEDYVRAADSATRSLEDGAQRLVRAEEARERQIQRQIKSHMDLVREADSLRRSYEDLSASFSTMEKATLSYYRTEEMLKKGMDAGVVTGTEYARVMELVNQRLVEAAGAVRLQDEEARIALQEKSNAELAKTGAAYDAVISSVDKAYAANIRYSDSLVKINDAYEAQIISENQRLDAIKLVTDQFNRDIESPRIKQMERERDEAEKLKSANAQLAAEYGRLTASVNPAVRGQQIYDNAIKTLSRSLEAGIIDQQQFNATLADVRVQMERSGHTVNQFGQVMSTTERGFAKFARGGMQQLGYQVGDFAVQVQGGTSMLVAFGQQGAQLAGIFGATGAVIGAGIAIVTSLAHAYLMARGEGKSLSQTTSDMSTSFQTLNSTLDDLINNDFASTFGDLSSDIKRMTEAALELDSAMSLKNMIDTLDKLKSEYVDAGVLQQMQSYFLSFGGMGAGGGIGGGMGSVDASAMQKEMEAQSRAENFGKLGFDMGYDAFESYQRGINDAAQSGDLSEVTRLLSDMFVDAASNQESAQRIIASGGYDMLNAYRQLALAIAEVNAKRKEYEEGRPLQTEMVIAKERGHMEAISSATDYASKAAYRRYQEESKVLDVIDKISKKMVEQRGHAEAIRSAQDEGSVGAYDRYVKDREHAEYLIAGVRQQGIEQYRTYQKSIDQDRMSDERLIITARQQGIEQYRAYQQATDQNRRADEKLTQDALVKTLMDAYKAGEDLTKLDLALGIDGAAIVAANLAQQLGISLATARAIVGLGAARPKDATVYDPREPGYDPEKAALGRTRAIMGGAPTYTPPAPVDTGGGTGGVGGGGVTRDPMAELRKQIALEREMIGLTEEQKKIYQALGDERSKYSKTELDALEAEIKSLEDKKKAIADMQSISDTVQSSMSQAFMSMVDGTATVDDAFKTMARSIIEQLYQVMVVQRIVGQFDAATNTGTGLVGSLMKIIGGAAGAMTPAAATQAQGGAWAGGSQLSAYANGGIVTTPTMFGMSGGRRGLMGEAGPEAILPLKRTSSGKLGVAVSGGGTNAVSENINISNVFNVSGSDAETVRREINKALPRISEVTKASVLDARRRGGKMMATFG